MVHKNERSFYFVPKPTLATPLNRFLCPWVNAASARLGPAHMSIRRLPWLAKAGKPDGARIDRQRPHWLRSLTQQYVQTGVELLAGLAAPATAAISQQAPLQESHERGCPNLRTHCG